ncbi:MAG TPA: CDP-alcohol phosphatidyltransferase family protein [Planctomycetota bacterium]|nr:CDP-alcohol phosphatidyltransferase family protein [Planctomycetota bacterium]
MPVAALQTWLRVQAAVWLPALVVLGVCGAAGPVPGWAHALLAGIAVSFASLAWILRAGNLADLVTMARVALLLVVIGLGAGQPGFAVWTAAVAVVLLDLVDGALARRFGASPGGAVLDMEADQLATLGLAALVFSIGGKAWVLLLPAMRPAFVLAAWWLGIPAHEPKPVNGDNRRGRAVCAAVMIALLIALCPATGPFVRDVVTGIAVLLLAWSFLADARFLLAHRARARA